MAKALAPENVRQVHLDHRQPGGRKGIEYRDRGVGQSPRIKDDPICRFACLRDPVDGLSFVMALAKIDLQVERGSSRQTALLYVGQGVMAIDRRFADPKQVQVRTVQNKDRRQASTPQRV